MNSPPQDAAAAATPRTITRLLKSWQEGEDTAAVADVENIHVGAAPLAEGLAQRLVETRFDVAVVRHVVAGVLHRRGVPGTDPHGVHPKAGKVGQPGTDPVDVPDTVAVGVGEAARVDLIDDGAPPPGVGIDEVASMRR